MVGLATCELLGLVKLNSDAVNHSVSPASDQSKFTKEIPVQEEIHPLPPTGTKQRARRILRNGSLIALMTLDVSRVKNNST